jgi:hypothetical protein
VSRPVRFTGLAAIAVCVGAAAVTTCPVAAFGANLQAAAVPVVINEVLASNGHTLVDPQGEYDDWIELYNRGGAPVNLGGMYLTDDSAEPTRWQFPTNTPAQTTIPAHGYLLVWADGEVGDSGLHASFKLSASGETVALFDRDGLTPIDSASFDAQRTDISYGRFPDGADIWSPLTTPTPGTQNISVYQGFVEKPQFSSERGFYEGEVLVSITCATPGATIYYTTDGSMPYQAAGGVRSGAIAIPYAVPVRIAKTTCLRAAALKTGWYPSPVETSTYIFVKDVITQSPTGAKPGPAWPSSGVNGQTLDYGMDPDVVNDPRYKNLMDDALLAVPSVSLVTDLANLFDPQKGIYVNALNLGPTWERPVSVELIYPDGTDGFQIDAGLRIRGGYSRADGNPKHAFRLFFDAQYGDPKLRYPLFDEEGVGEFECVDLRTSQNYSWSYEGGNSNSHDTFVREVFSRDTQRDMGQPYTRSRYYHLYLNGQYWGLFQTQERPEASFAASYFGGDKEEYDVIKSRGGGGEGYDIEATDGTLDAWRQLWEAAGSGFGNDNTYYRVQGLNPDGTRNPSYPKLLDIDNLLDYMLCTYYVGDPDGPVSAWALVANNFFGIYNRVHPDGFKFFRHDAEHSLYDLQESRLFAATTIAVGSSFNQSNPLWMHTHLMAHPEYRMRLADRVYKDFFNDGVLTPKACADRFMARVHRIEMAIIAESARWGDSKRAKPRTKDDDWLPDINRMTASYFPARTGVVLNQFKSQGWWPSVDPPAVSTRGGHVAAGSSLQMTSTGTIYYALDGTDPRLPEKAGRTADTQTLVAATAAKRVLVPTRDIGDAWKGGGAFDDSAWTSVTSGPGGVGYERGSGYQQYLSIDLGPQMYNKQATCYIRIPFTVPNTTYANLLLKVRYDDGFIAYLNGTEVARRNFTGNPQWNSVGSADNPDAAAVAQETINVSASMGLLRSGTNLLAIHGLNGTIDSSDFLISVELSGTKGAPGSAAPAGVAASAIRYAGPIVLSKSTGVKARTLSGSTWSALNEAVFAVGPVAQSLRVSEIMYHPADTGNPNDPNTEFLELTNIANQSINLSLVRFTDGIDYAFPSFELPAGGYCLVVKDLVAFQAKYGTKLAVVGEYAGSLDNGGERLELVDAAGQMIQSFTYDDGWFKNTDGQGYSLTVKDPKATGVNSLNDKAAWQSSAQKGGSPGRAGP